jgi:hypothetical protein
MTDHRQVATAECQHADKFSLGCWTQRSPSLGDQTRREPSPSIVMVGFQMPGWAAHNGWASHIGKFGGCLCSERPGRWISLLNAMHVCWCDPVRCAGHSERIRLTMSFVRSGGRRARECQDTVVDCPMHITRPPSLAGGSTEHPDNEVLRST